MSNVDKNQDNQNHGNNVDAAGTKEAGITAVFIPLGEFTQKEAVIKMERNFSLTDLSVSFEIDTTDEDTIKGMVVRSFSGPEKDAFRQLDITMPDQDVRATSKAPSVKVNMLPDGKKMRVAIDIPIGTKVPGGTGERGVASEDETGKTPTIN
ncbi:hypothetical protein [Chitinophaga pinensis]|uniref:Uncharacterized protein n=1 Tax=Chitinophaga pinensis (strain ATCC 43595 / DSM 2588 / LMG 13176 / NBRC 15968 / NCIMB 11800 / UQM 2034) TaxID=485918 RepID=A0A979G6W8_CHIPD|nr:hypothetical protein [Chitinophaga pinensis]ACU61742.1 hypothetical protein Cpin_4293 [Chitinophaga pinensis DSM 2588]